MDSPARKLQKQKDYQRHKMFRKMARKRKAKAEQEQKVAEKALKRKLKLPKYDKGEDDNTPNPKSNNAANKRRIVDYGDGSLYSYPEIFDKNLPYEVTIPEVVVTAKSKYNPYSWGSIVPFEYSRNSYYKPEDALEAFNTITFGLSNTISPTQMARRIYDIKDVLNGSMSGQQYWNRWINGNEGLVSKKYTQENPFSSMIINGAADIFTLSGGLTKIPGIIRNLTPQNLRNYWYVSKPPIGYDGIKNAIIRQIRGVLSGKKADIENPWWFNSDNAKRLESYAYVPDGVSEAEKAAYLKQFGEHALEARTDAWRMHNLIPQKFNTFTNNPKHPGSFTDVEGIKRLKWIPQQIKGTQQIDFINSAGGNIGTPEIINLGAGISDKDVLIQKFGVTTTSDWFDLHPFSRQGDRLIPRIIKPIWKKYISDPIYTDYRLINKFSNHLKYNNVGIKDYLSKANEYELEMFDPDMFPATGIKRWVGEVFGEIANKMKKASKIPEFRFLKPLEDKIATLEVGDITGGKPFLMQYDIPWTSKTTITTDVAKPFETKYIPGFHSENLFPQGVFDWKKGVYKINEDINNFKSILNGQFDKGKDKIRIKPSKRGTFTAAAKKHGASVQEYARRVLKAPKGKYSAAMRRKANFARVFGGRNY